MAAETAKKFEALEAQAQTLMARFIAAGHEAVAPAIIQPAGVFLDVIGEAVRARTYVFTDPDGDELCLRPDLTVPTCRLYLERHPGANVAAKYCYNGAAFRYQPAGADRAHPREFRQAGIEAFGNREREKAEAATVALILEALRAAGLAEVELRIGDLGLFRALLRSLEMPERWRQHLMHRFWRPEAFHAEVKRLVSDPAAALTGRPGALIAALGTGGRVEAERHVAAYLEREGIELAGVRTLGEITERLRWIAADAKATPLSPATARLIESYVRIRAPAASACARLKEQARDRGPEMAKALETFEERLDVLSDLGIDAGRAEFSAEFGRMLGYYTGFVFEAVAPALGPSSPVAGGGRYDGLLKAVGAGADVPSVGAAIHTERLLAAVAGAKP